MHFTILLLCLSVLSTLIMIFLYRSAKIDRDFYMKLERERHRAMLNLQASYNRLPLRTVGQVPASLSEQEMRVAELNDTITAGCKIIDDQKRTIDTLRGLLKKSQRLNRLQKRYK
jgi:uncharacterized coiled-coil protein SlyX